MGKIGIGIIGLGMGECMFSIRNIKNTDLEIRAICDINQKRLDEIKDKHNIKKATTDYRDLLKDKDIDVIGIYTPDSMHAQQCLAAFESGKHIICTKPFTDNLEEAIAVAKKSKEKDLKLLVGQTCRFVEHFNAAHKTYEQGKLGDILVMSASYVHDMRGVFNYTPWRYEIPQKLLYGGLCHPVDLIIWFLGFPKEVFAVSHESKMDNRYPSGDGKFPDNWFIDLLYPTKQLAKVTGLFGIVHSPQPMLELSLYGTKASVVNENAIFNNDINKVIAIKDNDKNYSVEKDYSGHSSEVVQYMLHFENCLKTNTRPLIDAQIGAQIISVLDACERSSISGNIERILDVMSMI